MSQCSNIFQMAAYMKHLTETTQTLHREKWIAVTLLIVLVITRSGHFGSDIKLPDASWAMFWLCGALTTRWWWAALLMIAAALVDYIVINHGVSSYCMTPAYPFLVPTYLALWFSGRWITHPLDAEVRPVSRVIISLTTGVTIAFVISNASFYTLSGYFSKLTAWQYAQDVAHYWPHYMIYTALYAICGLLIRFVIRSIQDFRASHQASS